MGGIKESNMDPGKSNVDPGKGNVNPGKSNVAPERVTWTLYSKRMMQVFSGGVVM